MDGVQEDVGRRGGRGGEGGPLPVVVLGVEQEVGAHNGDAGGDDAEDEEHEQHEAVHIVHLRPGAGTGMLMRPTVLSLAA